VLLAFLAAEVRRQNELLLEALYVPVERRVLRRLVGLRARYGRDDGEIPLTQEQLAELAGTSRATVNNVLRKEQERGTVELRRGRSCWSRTNSPAAPADARTGDRRERLPPRPDADVAYGHLEPTASGAATATIRVSLA
jgi:hypothetical protein